MGAEGDFSMSRLAPQIRDAGPQDAAELLDLWADSARSGMHTLRAQEDAERALANLAADPDQRLLVAESDDRIVAAMKLSRGPISPLALESVLHTSFLVVRPEYRRHGYGHALLDAALSWAEEKDIHDVTAITDGNRETNRFFARLGLSTLGTMRRSSVAGLRKKLSSERRHHGGNRHLVEVLAQRRSMRRRQESV
jgi:GNAT superfamily N-acetyltransferase